MTEEEAKDVVERIQYELSHPHGRVATRIEIHDVGLWTRLEGACGTNYNAVGGCTLFEKPVVLGPKCDASYTILYQV